MSNNTVYLVTGANRGIGLALVSHLLHRPDTTVIATFRASSPSPLDPSTLDSHPSSTLIPLPLSISPIPSTEALKAMLLPHKVTHIDTLIANAGGTAGFRDVSGTGAEDMRADFEVNAVGTAEMFRVCWPLMEGRSGTVVKRLAVVSSSVGSIGCLGEENMPATAYGMSKAAQNWWARKVSLDFGGRGLAVVVLHPGWVKTAMGQGIADALGLKEGGPTLTPEDSAKGLLEQIDQLTLENSGQFKTYTGQTLPW